MKNDQKITELRQQIAIKKEQLKTRPKISYITNGLLKLSDTEVYNLNVLNISECFNLVAKLCQINHSVELANFELETNYPCIFNDFLFGEWVSDIHQRMALLNWEVEKGKLTKMDNKLAELLSEEAKTKGSIDDIAKELGL